MAAFIVPFSDMIIMETGEGEMKRVLMGTAIIAAACLAGCNKKVESAENPNGPNPHGRYLGVGVYPADVLWSKMVVPAKPRDTAAATTEDDGHVIVVLDSRTGEIRQCGNMTGYCVGMNPWGGALSGPQMTPISLTKHAAELASEMSNQTAPVDIAANTTADDIPSGNTARPISRH
jgi:hypothetical protein